MSGWYLAWLIFGLVCAWVIFGRVLFLILDAIIDPENPMIRDNYGSTWFFSIAWPLTLVIAIALAVTAVTPKTAPFFKSIDRVIWQFGYRIGQWFRRKATK